MRLFETLAVLVFGVMVALWAFDAFFGNPPPPILVYDRTDEFFGEDQEFQQRVGVAYPAPYSLALLTKDLAEQGFTLDGRSAVFESGEFPCRYTWAIFWQVEGDKAT